MGVSPVWALVPLIALTSAFKDTSPFFLLSTSELLIPTQPNLVSASTLSEVLIPQLETCPSDTYVVISQPGVHAADFADKRATPQLRQMVRGDDKHIRSSLGIRDVLGSLDTSAFANVVKEKCGAGFLRVDASTGNFEIADDMRPRVIHLDFPALPTQKGERAMKLAENDAFLSSILDLLTSPSYTILYTTTANPSHSPSSRPQQDDSSSSWEPSTSYQMDTSLFHQAPVHMDLKRDFSSSKSTANRAQKRSSEDNPTLPNGPLFERYSFLSPGLFMGILVSLILLQILYVGIRAIAGLEVSYAAFDREMGALAGAGAGGKKG